MNREEYDFARACLDECLSLSLLPGGRAELAARALMDIAQIELTQRNIEAALNAFEQATILAGKGKSHALQAKAQYAISSLYFLARDWDGADRYHDQYLAHKYRVRTDCMEKEVSFMRVAAKVDAKRHIWAQQNP